VKNLTSLIVVSCLLIVLGCKCQSDLFETAKKETPTPSAAPSATPSASPSASATPDNMNRRRDIASSENPVLATGTYTGKGKNVTYNQTGDILLRIDSVDSDGNVKAYLEASNGLRGKADMEGTVSRDGKLEMSGTLDDGQSAAINGTVSGNTIRAGYGLADSNLKTQSGNFTVTRR
jgi:hypothetical protein